MGAVVFSDVHADDSAIAELISCIKTEEFTDYFGPIDVLVNLGDILHRGYRPKEALQLLLSLSKEFRLISIMGNHDHAFLNRLLVSGSDELSTYRHEKLRGSPMLSIFAGMPMEWVDESMLFVHGGPLDIGTSTLRLKCWQRLGKKAGDFITGYHFTPDMAFDVLRSRRLSHLCCGHQHTPICCQKTPEGIKNYELRYLPIERIRNTFYALDVARVPLNEPTILRIGACNGKYPEFAYTDFKTFTFIRFLKSGKSK